MGFTWPWAKKQETQIVRLPRLIFFQNNELHAVGIRIYTPRECAEYLEEYKAKDASERVRVRKEEIVETLALTGEHASELVKKIHEVLGIVGPTMALEVTNFGTAEEQEQILGRYDRVHHMHRMTYENAIALLKTHQYKVTKVQEARAS